MTSQHLLDGQQKCIRKINRKNATAKTKEKWSKCLMTYNRCIMMEETLNTKPQSHNPI
jgi:hypothetical protein